MGWWVHEKYIQILFSFQKFLIQFFSHRQLRRKWIARMVLCTFIGHIHSIRDFHCWLRIFVHPLWLRSQQFLHNIQSDSMFDRERNVSATSSTGSHFTFGSTPKLCCHIVCGVLNMVSTCQQSKSKMPFRRTGGIKRQRQSSKEIDNCNGIWRIVDNLTKFSSFCHLDYNWSNKHRRFNHLDGLLVVQLIEVGIKSVRNNCTRYWKARCVYMRVCMPI